MDHPELVERENTDLLGRPNTKTVSIFMVFLFGQNIENLADSTV